MNSKPSKKMSRSIFIALISGLFVSQSFASEECGIPAEDKAPGLFGMNGKPYSVYDLDLNAQQALYEAKLKLFHQQQEIINDFVLRDWVMNEASKQSQPVELIFKKLMDTPPPSEDELKAFYEQNKDQIPDAYGQVKKRIATFLEKEKAFKHRLNKIEQIKKSQDFGLLLEPPIPPVIDINTEGFPSKGNADAKVTIIEFADYQCPHCKKAAEAIKTLFATYKNDLKFVYMDFPVNRSGISRKVAEGAVCADKQSKFWEYHDLAFEMQNSLSNDSPINIAKELSLDSALFSSCLSSDETKQKVMEAELEGTRLAITGTPSIFVNGVKLHAHGDLTGALEKRIKEVLSDVE